MIPEVVEWFKTIAIEAPVLEVGSYDVNGGVREFMPKAYTGLDAREGAGVDVVADITTYETDKKFATVVCLETLEHITEPWVALERMHAALKPGGLFVGSWVFCWSIHDYPRDYYRVTPDGFRYLLERAGFKDVTSVLGGQPDTHVLATGRA